MYAVVSVLQQLIFQINISYHDCAAILLCAWLLVSNILLYNKKIDQCVRHCDCHTITDPILNKLSGVVRTWLKAMGFQEISTTT